MRRKGSPEELERRRYRAIQGPEGKVWRAAVDESEEVGGWTDGGPLEIEAW